MKTSDTAKLKNTRAPYITNTFQKALASETYQKYDGITGKQILLPGDFRANLLAAPGSAEAKKMTVRSGRRCLEQYEKYLRGGLLARMFLGSSVWNSMQRFLIWVPLATPRKHLLFQLVPLARRIDETGSGLFLGTLTARSSVRSKKWRKGKNPNPQEYVAMMPTLKAQDCRAALRDRGKSNLGEQIQGQNPGGLLSPMWAEWFMGYPIGWTELKPSETQSFRKSPRK
jgi:hypothetical protein